MILLSRKSAEKYLKQISPHEEETQLILLSGNEVGMNLIRGNAYQEAIAYLQGLDQKCVPQKRFISKMSLPRQA